MGKTFVEDERPCDSCVNVTRYGCVSWNCEYINRDEAIKAWREKHEMADRKTENSSEKPNNCEECKHWNDTEDGCADRHGCRTTTEDWQDWKDRMWSEAIVTEPTTEDCSTVPTSSKMEQVETMSCAECKHRPIGAEICEEPCHYEPQTDWHYDEQDATWYPYKHEDEPQTCSFSDCDNFKNPDYERCIECKRKQIKLKTEPQTERGE